VERPRAARLRGFFFLAVYVGGIWYYGIVQMPLSPKHPKPKPGHVFVEDAIFPKLHEVLESELVDIPIHDDSKPRPWENEFVEFVNTEFEHAQEVSDRLPPGVQKGALFGTLRGDGTAWYVVTKVNKRTAKVEWRGFSIDRWWDPMLGMGKTVPIDMIEPFCRAKGLFGRKRF